jgi:hypothetical protein
VYKNVVSLKAAMKLEWKTSIMSTEEKPIKTGLESNKRTLFSFYYSNLNSQYVSRMDFTI